MSIRNQLKQGLFAAVSAVSLGAALAGGANAIPYRDDVGDQGAQDFAAPWDGVIQIYMWNRNTGQIFFNCTGSLINARTVITAAHCLNNTSSENYGNSGEPLTPIIAFGPDTFVPLFNWIDTGQQFFDGRNGLTFGNDVIIHPDGAFDGFSFPAADVAMISLDNPLYTLPTYSMLFSAIPDEVMEAGVHVNMIGYGSFGPGSSGTVGINGKRRAGENMLGLLGSQNDFIQALAQNESAGFDSPSDNQLLYWIDFDAPGRTGTCERGSAFSFPNSIVCSDWDGFSGVLLDGDTLVLPGTSLDLFPGDALPNEVGTAGGDSGGPLMAMNLHANPLILGVLSGGFIDGFFHPAGQEYASVSYYNPLFTYFQFIAENNPYKYVSAVEGDGNWSDASHWVQTLDPHYMIYNGNGEIVNGLPDGVEGGTDQRRPTSGIVFDTPVEDYDQDDEPANPNPPTNPAANDAGGGLAASVTDFAADGVVAATGNAVVGKTAIGGEMGFAEAGRQTVSGQTQTLTGPGYTGFVPYNTFGTPGTRFANPAQFFEVTLSADGTTTVDMNVWIDKLNLAGSGARLLIDTSYALFAENNVELFAGNLTVDGDLISRELVLWGGVLNGSGVIDLFETNLLFGNGVFVDGTLFNIAGAVNAGNLGETGTLTMFGDYVQSSAGALVVDMDANGADVFNVFGDVSLGGVVGVNILSGYMPQWGDRQRILNHSGVRVGAFDAVADLPGVLYFSPVYGAGFVDLEILAADFSTVANFTSPSQEGIASFLDRARGTDYATLSDLYTYLDLQSGDTLIGSLENLTPHEAFQFRRTAGVHNFAFANALRRYILTAPGAAGSQGNGAAMFSLVGSQSGQSMAGMDLAMAAQDPARGPQVRELVDGVEIFFAAGALDGQLETSSGSVESANLDGAFAQAGINAQVRENVRLGAAIGFANSDAEQVLPGAGARADSDTETTSLTGYALYQPGNWTGMASLSWADHSTSTMRSARIGPNLFSAQGDQDATTLEAQTLIAYTVAGESWSFTPVGSLTWRETEFDAASQTGSIVALDLDEDIEGQLVSRLGGQLATSKRVRDIVLEPRLYVGVAHDWRQGDDTFFAEFGAVPGSPVQLGSGVKMATGWAELSAELVARLPNGLAASIAYDMRSTQTYGFDTNTVSASVRYRF